MELDGSEGEEDGLTFDDIPKQGKFFPYAGSLELRYYFVFLNGR